MSYNIRYDNPADSSNAWEYRKERLANLITFYNPDFLGTQEGLPRQVAYLKQSLSKMKMIGQGRNGGQEGEFSALFYNNDRFELMGNSDSTLWLSQTTDRPSKSWDAALPRIVTFGKFRVRNTEEQFYVFNTHYDHIGDTARTESSRLILAIIEEIAGDYPVVLTGDFNTVEGTTPYQILTNSGSGLSDAFFETELPHSGPLFTFEGFEVMSENEKRRIDYIFTSDNLKVKTHAIISDFRNGHYPSDHLPVIADILLQ